MKKIPAIILSNVSLSLILFAVFTAVYWLSVPGEFNTNDENRKYFDSDGEFIVRQFHQNKIYTHNDHLLYHILGKSIAQGSTSDNRPADPVTAHKLLSVISGALGVSFFYLMGALITKRRVLPLVCAVFVGGTAGWWFFSATIDTYVPCLSISIPVLGLAVLSLENDSRYKSLAIGALIGLAFLLRTDSILLVLLGVYMFRHKKTFVANALYASGAALIVGLVGYVILSCIAYDIDLTPSAMWNWMSGSTLRPESADAKIWGVTKNLTARNSLLVLMNQVFYTVLLPGLERTRCSSFYLAYTKGGWIGFIIWTGALSTAVYHFAKGVEARRRKGDSTLIFAGILAGIWFLSRMLFYTWWDPFDPFLFAVMTVPALWLVLLLGFDRATSNGSQAGKPIIYWSILGVLTATVWIHNLYYLISPLNS